ncbi:hypothetical protein K432DRAFT_397636 [Lepidopterella palustris CBS 459.81]|uniref:Secreted protein n=1 Tax=Lepidopterella palustris CBS 459.81 TaxID=1314670 RepID=A0A8E2JA80_9PEZI|nr:hypothetical protein K432DRAFT_397636 [Lepidopterella palustris CBS 459.81]
MLPLALLLPVILAATCDSISGPIVLTTSIAFSLTTFRATVVVAVVQITDHRTGPSTEQDILAGSMLWSSMLTTPLTTFCDPSANLLFSDPPSISACVSSLYS